MEDFSDGFTCESSVNSSKEFSFNPSLEPSLMTTVDPSTFTFNGPKKIERASDENDYDGIIAKPHTDYVRRFTIEPTGVHKYNTNIIHITTGGDCCAYGTRVPTVIFLKKTTKLFVGTGYNSLR